MAEFAEERFQEWIVGWRPYASQWMESCPARLRQHPCALHLLACLSMSAGALEMEACPTTLPLPVTSTSTSAATDFNADEDGDDDDNVWLNEAGRVCLALVVQWIACRAVHDFCRLSVPVSRGLAEWRRRLNRMRKGSGWHRWLATEAVLYSLETLPDRSLSGWCRSESDIASNVMAVSDSRPRPVVDWAFGSLRRLYQLGGVVVVWAWSARTLWMSRLLSEMEDKRSQLHRLQSHQAACLGLLVQLGPFGHRFRARHYWLDTCGRLALISAVLEHYKVGAFPRPTTPTSQQGSLSDFVVTADFVSRVRESGQSVPSNMDGCLRLVHNCLERLQGLAITSRALQRPMDPPSPRKRIWWSAMTGAVIGITAVLYAWNRRDRLAYYMTECGRTLHRFFAHWILAPAVRIFKTIRHEDSLRLTAGSLSLSADLDSLERMVTEFARDQGQLSVDEVHLIGERARQGDMSVVLKRYEDHLKHPLQSLVLDDMARVLLIQVHKAKVDLEVAMQALDKLLRSNELNFAFLAILPSVAILSSVWRVARMALGSGSRRRAHLWRSRIRPSLRNVDRILTQYHTASDVLELPCHALGLLLIETQSIREAVSKRMSGDWESEALQEDIRDLENAETSLGQKQHILARLHRTIPEFYSEAGGATVTPL